MADTVSHMKQLLRELNDNIPSPIDEYFVLKNVGNYQIYPEDLTGQIIDWVVNYLENKKCPHALALVIAQRTLERIAASFFKQIEIDDEDSEKFPNATSLYMEAMNQLPSVCSTLLDESNLEESFSSVGPSLYTASAFATRNKRRKMEDKHVIYPDLNSVLNIKDAPLHSYYAVFDGHSGIEAANFASAQLHVNIAKHPCFLLDTTTAIREAYKITDESFLKRCAKENIKSGCTVLCALVQENKIYISWLGDSQAVLIKQGKPTIITSSHKPDREDERRRIEKLGGHITFSGVLRVNGVLAVTRALGDPDHKPYISNEPEISILTLDGSEDFLVLACDGLWDGMSPEDVTTSLYHYIMDASPAEPSDTVAAKLVHRAKLQGSEDNITAVVVYLRDLEAIKEDAKNFYSNLPKVDLLQQEMFSMNGQDYEITPASFNGDTFVKPNVLELNVTSTKKLKNTANVLSSTGLGNSCYQYVENESSMIFQAMSTDHGDGACGISIPQQNSAYFAPETTALSELPTPPIDDILASQQFESFSHSKQQDISFSKVEQCEYSYFQQSGDALDNRTDEIQSDPVEIPSQFATISGNFDLLSGSETVKNMMQNSSSVISSVEAITPEEAIGIASSVVSNAIESAVQRLSSPEMSQENSLQSPTKLNPYAEPFVMKSFCVEEPLPNLCTLNKETIDQEMCLDAGDVTNLQSLDNNNVSDKVKDENANSTNDNTTVETKKNNIDIEKVETVCTESLQTSVSSSIVDSFANLHLSENETKKIVSSENLCNENAIFDIQASTIKLENETNKALSCTVNDTALNINDELVSPDNSLNHLKEIKDNNEDLNSAISANKKDSLDSEPIRNSVEQHVLCCDELNKTTSEDSHLNTLQMSDVPPVNKCTDEKVNIVTLSDLQQEVEVPSAPLLLENISPELVEISLQGDHKTTEAVLPSSDEVELPVETVAVDLQSIPVGVPEAEGVTEDIDSDSEKDGGWSYMKGSNDTNVKSKEKEQQTLKKGTKSETISKAKKEISKPVVESKTKKSSILNDKNKLHLAGRKVDIKDTKERNKMVKPATVASVAKTAIEKTRIATNAARSQKETIAATSKSSVAVTNKVPKVAASRSIGAVAAKLPNSGSTAKNVPSKVSSSTLRPKPAVTMPGAKTSTPTRSSTLPKGQPSNQSNKVNAPPVRNVPSRPATSVPSKVSVAAKPMPLTRPVSSAASTKPLSTIRKTTLSTVKRADVKEAKDTVNKQISADKNRALGSLKTETNTRVVSYKRTDVASNVKSTISKTASGPSSKKEILRKDMPKIQSSKPVAKSALSSKLTKSLVREKPVPKEAQKEEISVQAVQGIAAEITPISDEEKFILETNVKETVKESQETSPEAIQICYENGNIEDIKTAEKCYSAEDFISENP
ncbi:uncharacterized protein LOC129219948 [Uloborus diversus]|uniref:uncharacterized protein LOC129219948 n=1 Tax=Uloborus diversus TaxID=327109 RepID=UPI002409E28C|nr:uncharacterized protein LOC129219948 [Uloborus diversus]